METYLNKKEIPDFAVHLMNQEYKMTNNHLVVLQINMGRLCNLSCKHCHVEAGPNRTEVMPKEVLIACLKAYKTQGFETIDITGGAPEMNPNFEWFIEEAVKICNHVIVRTNLVILLQEQYKHLLKIYAKNKVEIVCSLPCYTSENTDAQRGLHTFEGSVKVLHQLNELGYGKQKDLALHLVYNPGGAFLPPDQVELEEAYKIKLKEEYNIEFNHLYVITNNPMGRFKKALEHNKEYDSYMNTLFESYNNETEQAMMCRNQISVGYDGRLYDCDFNQCIELEIINKKNIFDISNEKMQARTICFGTHCYACTAGKGSSCGGSLS